MRIRIVNFFESIFNFGFFVPDYNFLYAVATVLGIYLVIQNAENKGLDVKKVFWACLITVAFTFISARFYVVFQQIGYYMQQPIEIFKFWKTGTASSGAYIGGVVGAFFATRSLKLSTANFLDCCAPSVVLAIVLGRIGCFLNGCCYGKISSLPWAMRFPEGSGPYYDHLQSGFITANQLSLPVHPTQLYEVSYALVLFFFFMLYKKYQKQDGELFAVLFILYPLGRFFNEFLRADDRGSVLIFSFPQFVSIVAIIISVFFLVLKNMSIKKITLDLSGD